MYAVGRLGSYITRGVYTVSGPFHPFGGAVDIIVVEQQDGSFKSSPWYVRFGKFQGVLKTKEKVVTISVNGVEADFHMYLDHKGEAYFLREADVEEEDSLLSFSSSGEEMDGQSGHRRPTMYKTFNFDSKQSDSVSIMKSKSCNFDASQSDSVSHLHANNGKVVSRTVSRSRIFGLVFGKKSMKENKFQEEVDDAGVVGADSLERAEIAADLLEVKWSTNLAFRHPKEDFVSQYSAPDNLNAETDKDKHANYEHSKVDSLLHDDLGNSMDHPMSHEAAGPLDHEIRNNSHSSLKKMERSVEENGVEAACLITEYVTRTSTSQQGALEDNTELDSKTLRKVSELGVTFTDSGEHFKAFISEIAPGSQIPDSAKLEACLLREKLDEGQVSDEKGVGLPDSGASEQNGTDKIQSFVYFETLEGSGISSDNLGEKVDNSLDFSGGGCEHVHAQAETLHEMTELISEIKSQPESGLLVGNKNLDFQGISMDKNSCKFLNDAKILKNERTSADSLVTSIVAETSSPRVAVRPLNGSAGEIESQSVFISSVRDVKNIAEEDNVSEFQSSLEAVGGPKQVPGDFVPIDTINISPLEGVEDEQLLFGDLDDLECSEFKCMKSLLPGHLEEDFHPSHTPRGTEVVDVAISLYHESNSSPDNFVQEDVPSDVEALRWESKIMSSEIDIPKNSKVVGDESQWMVKSLPNVWPQDNNLQYNDHLPLGHSLDSISKTSKWTAPRKNTSTCINSDEKNNQHVSQAQSSVQEVMISEELKDMSVDPAIGDPSKPIDASSGNRWRLWPFPINRSRSTKPAQPALDSSGNSDAGNALESGSNMDEEKDAPKPKAHKKKIRTIFPTSEQLAALNLKEGKNAVTFRFSTAMLGKQEVDARIYLWRWDTRIVISDVDGTITKSDVLGQFMPLVGMDWSQTGVTNLFSAIKENGYQLLFLSARAISQAYHTRQFLFNLKQDGKALPDGPVVISPDGLFPSLFREVIRRAPHEFKIACLEDIKACFPPDTNPFYAGFGNRDTDEISYLKVGIPRGKIFIVNPKGEVAVNRRVDTKSYTSLHALVHGMFPSMSSSGQEDFNAWNYWKLPPPDLGI